MEIVLDVELDIIQKIVTMHVHNVQLDQSQQHKDQQDVNNAQD